MPFLHIDFQSEPADITLDDLIHKLLEQLPGAKITSQDWYAKRRVQTENIIAELRRKGRPMEYGDAIVNSVDRAAESCGPTKEITIPMVGGGSLCGRISRKLMLVHSDSLIDQQTVELVLSVLKPLGIVKDVLVSQEPGSRLLASLPPQRP